ncbi:MAG: hypothetical protein WB919_23115 [Candidatus Sulfotelmatobacter sp.]
MIPAHNRRNYTEKELRPLAKTLTPGWSGKSEATDPDIVMGPGDGEVQFSRRSG